MKKHIRMISLFAFAFIMLGLITVKAEVITGTSIADDEYGTITRGSFEGATKYKLFIQNTKYKGGKYDAGEITSETLKLTEALDASDGFCYKMGVSPYGATGYCQTDMIDTYKLTIVAYDSSDNELASSELYTEYDGTEFTSFEANKHLVTFVTTGTNVDNVFVDDGQVVAQPTGLTNGTLELEGWYVDGSIGYKYNFENTVTTDVTLNARWVCRVNAYAVPVEGGSLYTDDQNASTVHVDTWWDYNPSDSGEINVKVNSTDGYTFKEWRVGSTTGDVVVNNNSNDVFKYGGNKVYFWLKNSYNLYAIFEPVDDVLTVTFNTNGGSEIATQNVVKGYKAKTVTPPTKDDLTFMGWYTDSEFTNEFSFDNTITTNTILYAKWEDPNVAYTVTFDTDGGSAVQSQEVIVNGNATRPEDPTKDGFVFEDWYKDSSYTIKYNFSDSITGPTTIYARFISADTEYTITFNTNGGSEIANVTVTAGNKVTKPENPTKGTFIFSDWYIDSSFSKKYNFNDKVFENKTLYARYVSNIKVYSVPEEAGKFSVGLGTYTPTIDTNFYTDSGLAGVSVEDQEGYEFKEWRLGSVDGTVIDTVNTADVYQSATSSQLYFKPEKGSVVVYAIFEKKTFTVSFETNSSSTIEDASVVYQEKLAKPADPTNGDKIFAGWFTDSEFTKAYDFNSLVTESFTLYAKWVDEYKITSAPKISIAKGNNNSLVIKGPNNNNYKTYYIYRSTDKKKWTKIATVKLSNMPYTNTGLTYNKTYYYKVKVANKYGTYAKYSNVVSKKVVPNTVVNLKASTIKTSEIKLTWKKESVSGYEVYRSTDNKKWSKVTTIKKSSTVSYTNKKLKANKKYYYKVRAYKTVGKKKVYGSYSSILTVRTAPAKPNLTASYLSNTALKVSIPSVGGAVKYIFGVSTDGGTTYVDEDLTAATTKSFEDLEINKTYYYRVNACNSEDVCSGFKYVGKRVAPKVPGLKLSTTSKKVKVVVNKVNDVEGYVVERKVGKGKWNKTYKTYTASQTPTFTDKTKKGEKYYYRVRSFVTVSEKRVYSDYVTKDIKSK